jgi:oligopeptide/dipeptide ABC transporter ATP-binding protein
MSRLVEQSSAVDVASAQDDRTVVLDVQDLRTHLFTRRGVIRAVDGVSFQVRRGETLGIVGESGCGKSMTALSLLRLIPQPAARIIGGRVLLDGTDLLALSEQEMRKVRGRQIGLILQDPQASLNPVFTIGNQVQEAIQAPAPEARGGGFKQRALELLRMVQVPDAARRLRAYPHEISGGMKQRVVGAMALAGGPKVIVADEPTTSLDVTIQAQYLRLLKSFQTDLGVGIVFITHDFGVVGRMCDRAAVMYAGRIVEQGRVSDLFDRPSHPYTRALLNAVPRIDRVTAQLEAIEGQPPVMIDPAPGCHFAPRCPHAEARCLRDYPPYFVGPGGQLSACWKMDGTWAQVNT